MQVSEVMTHDVCIANPNQNLIDAAKMMAEGDCGVLPVGENDRLIGMITDRDIVVRALAQGKALNTQIREVMTNEVKYCFEEDDVNQVAHTMGNLQIRRLPVLNKDKRLTGIVSLGDIANTSETQSAAEALYGISDPTQHSEGGKLPH